MKRFLSNPLLLLVAIAGGVAWGVFFPQFNPSVLIPFVDLYFNVINLVVIPLIITSTIASIGILIRQQVIGRVFLRFAISVGVFFVAIVAIIFLLRFSFRGEIIAQQSENQTSFLSFSQALLEDVALKDTSSAAQDTRDPLLVGQVENIIPRNIFSSLIGNNLLSIIFFSIILGFVLGLFNREVSTSLITLFDSLYHAFQKIFHGAILFLPLGIITVVADFTQRVIANSEVALLAQSFLIVYGGVFLIQVVFAIAITAFSGKWSFSQITNYFLRILALSFTGSPSIIALPVILQMHDQQSSGHSVHVRSLASLSLVVLNVGAFAFFFCLSLFGKDFLQSAAGVMDYLSELWSSFLYSIFSNASDFNSISASIFGNVGEPLLQGFFQEILPFLFPIIALFSSLGSVAVLLLSSWGKKELVENPQEEFFLNTRFVDDSEDLLEEAEASVSAELPAQEPVSTSKKKIREARIFTIPLRLSMTTVITASLLIYGLISGILQLEGGRFSTFEIVHSLVSEIVSRSNDAVSSYLQSTETAAKNLRYIVENDILAWRGSQNNREQMLEYLRDAVIDKEENISAVYWATPDGRFYMQRSMPGGSFSVRTIGPSADGEFINNIWQHEDQSLDELFPSTVLGASDPSAYDPRRRPWYEAALNNPDGVWTDVYVFFSDRILGITYTFPIYEEDGSLAAVFGIDVSVLDLSVYLSNLNVVTRDQGQAFLFDSYSRELIAVSFGNADNLFSEQLYRENPLTEEFDPERISVELSPTELVKTAYASYEAELESSRNSASSWWGALLFQSTEDDRENNDLLSFVRFRYDDERYIFALAELSELSWMMGVVISEDVFMQYVYRNNEIQIIIILFLFVIMGIISSWFAKRITRSLGGLSDDMEKVRRLELVPVHTASFIREVAHMGTALENMKQGLDAFKRYIPSDVVVSLLEMGNRAEIGGTREEVTIFFSDIEDFTGKSEISSPEAILNELKGYFDVVSNVVSDHHGTIDKYIGDAVMAFWGAPKKLEDHAMHACMAAFRCQQRLKHMSSSIYNHTRIGLHTGRVLVGNVGSESRINYTILGDAVNLASRLEGLSKKYATSIIISQDTHDLVKTRFETRFLDKVVVKGKEKATTIYELLGLKGEDEFLLIGDPSIIKRFLMLYNEGTRYYRDRAWGKAASFFARAYELMPNDRPVKLLYARSYHFYQNPPPPEWSGLVKV